MNTVQPTFVKHPAEQAQDFWKKTETKKGVAQCDAVEKKIVEKYGEGKIFAKTLAVFFVKKMLSTHRLINELDGLQHQEIILSSSTSYLVPG